MIKYVLIFFLFVIIELYILILTGQYFGANFAIAIVIGSALSGILLGGLKFKKIKQNILKSVKKNQIPVSAVIDAISITIGFILIFLPGIITDLVGIILTFDISREILFKFLLPSIHSTKFVKLLKVKLEEEFIKKGLLKKH